MALTLLACRPPGEGARAIDAAQEENHDAANSAPAVMGFELRIFPLLVQAGCGECHTAERSVTSHWVLATPSETYRQWVTFPGFNHCDATGKQVDVPLPEQTRVIPGDPDGSLVVKKLTAPWEMCGLFFGHMPPSPRPRMPAEQIDMVRAWIAAGAPR